MDEICFVYPAWAYEEVLLERMLLKYDDLFRGLRNELIYELLKNALQEHSNARNTGMFYK